MKETIKTLAVIGLAAALVAGLSSCDKEKKSDVKKIQVAHTEQYVVPLKFAKSRI